MRLQSIILTILMLLLLSSCTQIERFWGSSLSPNRIYQINLLQQERKMHRTPNILVKVQQKGAVQEELLGIITLAEDNRSLIDYKFDWENGHKALLTLSCTNCMIPIRCYEISLKPKLTLTKLSTPEVFKKIVQYN